MKDGVSKSDYTAVIFVDLGVKVDGTYYCYLFLSHLSLPAIRRVSSEFIFQKIVPHHTGNAMFPDINISQSNVATPLKCDGMCNEVLLRISSRVTMKEF